MGKRRMSGEDGGEASALELTTKLRPRNRAVVGVGTDQPTGKLLNRRQIGPLACPADVGGQPHRTVGIGLIPHVMDQRVNAVERELALVDAAPDRERNRQYRIAERVLGRMQPRPFHLVQQISDDFQIHAPLPFRIREYANMPQRNEPLQGPWRHNFAGRRQVEPASEV